MKIQYVFTLDVDGGLARASEIYADIQAAIADACRDNKLKLPEIRAREIRPGAENAK